MIPEEIYKIGDLLGLENKDIQGLVIDKSSPDVTGDVEVPFSPVNSYKFGLYSTVSLNDFQ